MKELSGIIGFILLLGLFSAYTQGGLGGDGTASSTPLFSTESRDESSRVSGYESVDNTPEAPRTISSREIEENLRQLYSDLEYLKEEEREKRLRTPASPYQGVVTLGSGNARETAWGREYLTLAVSSDAKNPVDVTGWSVESLVTKERSQIPQGDRVIQNDERPVLEHILVYPGEYAYVITGRSPLKASFHENECTGYLETEKDFYPSLAQSCPNPLREMERFSRVSYTNDDCYDIVGGIGSCEIPDEDEIEDIRMSNACQNFILDELNYNACVRRHINDPLFDDTGSWYIYLGRTRDLWREEREIIRLIDNKGLIVDVIEY